MVTRTTLEVTVKNTVAQITKEFFGFGPRTAVRCKACGPVILHVTDLTGAAIMEDLAQRRTGQAVLQYNNRLLVERYRERLADLTSRALHKNLVALICDFDPAPRLIVGASLLDSPLNRAYQPAPALLTHCVRDALGGSPDATVQMGRGFFWAHLPAAEGLPAPPDLDDLGSLAEWQQWRTRFAHEFRTTCAEAGIRTDAIFAGIDRGHLLLGGILPDFGTR